MAGKRWRKRILALDEQEWEAICERCGRCCYERALETDGTPVAIGDPCPHLDVADHTCRVYHERFEVMPSCHKLTPRIIERPRFLPTGCAYRRLSEEARGPRSAGKAEAR